MNCRICRDTQLVRLPLHADPLLPTFVGPIEAMNPSETSKTYPCPECTPYAETYRVAVMSCQTVVDNRFRDLKQMMPSVMRDHAHALVEDLISNGFVTTREIKDDALNRDGKVILRSRFGIVSKAAVASIEERALEKAQELINDMVVESMARIVGWGRDYGLTDISKDRARQVVADVARDVMERAKSWAGRHG